MKKLLLTLTLVLAGSFAPSFGQTTVPDPCAVVALQEEEKKGTAITMVECGDKCIARYGRWSLYANACIFDCYLTAVGDLVTFWD